jgi:hypothetical protein
MCTRLRQRNGHPEPPDVRETYETILPLSELLGLRPDTRFTEGKEVALARTVSEPSTEHTRIVNAEHDDIAHNIVGLLNPAQLPREWPDGRFDVVMSFLRKEGSTGYIYSEIPQMLLAKDKEAPL